MKTIMILAFLPLIILLSGCQADKTSLTYNEFTFQWSDGNCTSSEQCQATEFGCGGGHTMCTSNPDKYKDIISTCEIVENHPSQQGFKCSCVLKDNKCGWIK